MNKKYYKYIIYLFLVSFLLTGITFSRFSTTLTNSNDGEPSGTTVSNPIILYVPQAGLAENGERLLALNNMDPSTPTQSYYFNIVNFNGSKTSDMPFLYTVSLDTLGALPLDFKIYDLDKGSFVPFMRNETAQISMPAGTNTTHRYRLDVSWKTGSTSMDDYRYSQEIDYVNIIVDAEQDE